MAKNECYEFQRGYICALSCIVRGHGTGTEVREALQAVNPDHLEPVTRRENIIRGISFSAANAAKTSCPYGHPYTPDNIKKCRTQKRNCLICRREQHKQYMRQRKLDRLAREGVK